MSTPFRPGTGGGRGRGLAKGTGWGGERRGGGLQHLSDSRRPSPSTSSSFSPPLCYHIPPSVWLSWIFKLTLVPVVAVVVVVVVFLWLRLSHSQSFVAPLSLLSSSTAPPPLISSLPHSLLSVNVGSLPSRFSLHVCEHVHKHFCVVGILTVVYPGASGSSVSLPVKHR